MNTDLDPKIAWPALGLTWVAYVVFVFLTRLSDFGLTIQADTIWLWMLLRVVTVSFWLGIAVTILYARRHPANWNSFLHAFFATGLVAFLLSPTLASESANLMAIIGSIIFYSLVSGMVCFTIVRPPIAALLGLLLFPGQLLVDMAVHVLSGLFRLH
jgi:hypothetical protein